MHTCLIQNNAWKVLQHNSFLRPNENTDRTLVEGDCGHDKVRFPVKPNEPEINLGSTSTPAPVSVDKEGGDYDPYVSGGVYTKTNDQETNTEKESDPKLEPLVPTVSP